MEHSNAARTLHQPTAELLQALAADAVLSGSSQDMAHALSRLSVPPVEAIVSAARVSDSGRAHALLGDVAKTKPQWLSVEDEHGDSPSRVAARRLDHKSLFIQAKIPDGDHAPVFLTDTISILVESGASLSFATTRASRRWILRSTPAYPVASCVSWAQPYPRKSRFLGSAEFLGGGGFEL